MARKIRKWEYKVVDDESGLVRKSSRITQRWDDALVDVKKGGEPDHPQKHVRALKTDPTGNEFIRKPFFPDQGVVILDTDTNDHDRRLFRDYVSAPLRPIVKIADTGLDRPVGPASHLFLAGIGSMVIGSKNQFISFTVGDR